jgi:hypothetical protein
MLLIQLKKIGTGNDEKAARANQLIGNLLIILLFWDITVNCL